MTLLDGKKEGTRCLKGDPSAFRRGKKPSANSRVSVVSQILPPNESGLQFLAAEGLYDQLLTRFNTSGADYLQYLSTNLPTVTPPRTSRILSVAEP